MVGNGRVSAVLVSTDLERSRSFFEEKVGLPLSPETIPNHLSLRLRQRVDAARLRPAEGESG
jgi:hypothetical protein